MELLNQQVQTGRERQEELVSRTNVAEARSGLAFGLLEALQAGDATGIERATDALTEAGFVSCRWECRSRAGSRGSRARRGASAAPRRPVTHNLMDFLALMTPPSGI